ncbi:TIGR03013 family XrtA/PEP-CTERM system glycosyltransferase [Thiohalomonas denitrificans]|uniref:Sugar transferase, PEP-CTERM system associated/exopolysaccharide biosynthesis polyprenyl glycosylphosphotransferase n=1 Tax=Thiohalomonas denitrificans TaxID=415747 RepID=A0A1G5Q2U5_9GAMM|nr:TIGR03013 family XrtA/PEP-CTERM system glycosyltransferase [Thiohalomonas denitrificans]SCZ55866.1 sugar transferase, PEP-CTERM system associated/exopolysaccharide biosynthesis polyprenyl glycosylphosphotransferase [Thiohalomonas denitrificans]
MPTIRIAGQYFRTPFVLLFGAELTFGVLSVYLAMTWLQTEAVLGEPWLWSAGVFGGTMTLSMAAMGLYQSGVWEGVISYLSRLVVALFGAGVILAIISYWTPTMTIDRTVVATAAGIAIAFITLDRLIFRRLVDSGALARKIIVLGTGAKARTISQIAEQTKSVEIVWFFPVAGEKFDVDSERIVHQPVKLSDLAEQYGCEEIVIATGERRNTLPMPELLACRARGIRVTDENSFVEKETGKISLDLLTPGWLVGSEGFRYGARARMLRRGFDLVTASLLLVFALPVMAVTALAIFFESGFSGPILYRQMRVGENGNLFEVLKFRSMRTDAESDGKARWAMTNDARITRVGKWIRRSRVDELPQLLNVLKGEMSFVGPRPERPEFVDELEKVIPFYAERHCMKPGLTGWAQLRYSYGASQDDAAQKLQYDLYYIKNHSFLMDLLILVQTAEVVVFGRGAR